jgi:hypothetical protein
MGPTDFRRSVQPAGLTAHGCSPAAGAHVPTLLSDGEHGPAAYGSADSREGDWYSAWIDLGGEG